VSASQLWRGGGASTSNWSPTFQKGARLCCICFVFLSSITIARLYKLTLSDQAQIAPRLTVCLSDEFKVFGRPARAARAGGGGPKNIFHSSPNPLPVALVFLLNRGVLHEEEVGLLNGKAREPPDWTQLNSDCATCFGLTRPTSGTCTYNSTLTELWNSITHK